LSIPVPPRWPEESSNHPGSKKAEKARAKSESLKLQLSPFALSEPVQAAKEMDNRPPNILSGPGKRTPTGAMARSRKIATWGRLPTCQNSGRLAIRATFPCRNIIGTGHILRIEI
jgi:hypothetical protein